MYINNPFFDDFFKTLVFQNNGKVSYKQKCAAKCNSLQELGPNETVTVGPNIFNYSPSLLFDTHPWLPGFHFCEDFFPFIIGEHVDA
jgi:hypothetical protein